ncbi:MAG: tetratricopeptide repeat protein [Bacteroidia bacterium]|nr:tetratricopeptide repeat protein [Bacteroidia bacterium]
MRLLITLTLVLFFAVNLFGQDEKIKELVSQGTQLHDEGKYDKAIKKYNAALDIDKNSSLANYELSYTYMTIEKYDDAIKYSKRVIELNGYNQQAAYTVLGTSLDMKGQPNDAIKAYREGLILFPNDNLLNYNLALTLNNTGDYDNAALAAINAILAKPTHGSSHIILSRAMKSKGERVKALLPLYYFLLLEPNSKRSLINLNMLQGMLNQGVEKQSEKKINITIPSAASKDTVFGPAEMMVSLKCANRFIDKNKGKTDAEFFVETNKSIFSMLGELKKNHKDLWWDLYVTKFYDLVQTDNIEAFSYYISQSSNSVEVNNWIANNQDKMKLFNEWMQK